MEYGELGRITKELEDLLMKENKNMKKMIDETAFAKEEPKLAAGETLDSEELDLDADFDFDPERDLELEGDFDPAEALEPEEDGMDPAGALPSEEASAAERDGFDLKEVLAAERDGFDQEEALEPEEDDFEQERARFWQRFDWDHSHDGLAAAFLVPVLIMLVIFVQRGIFPFGEESFLRTDMYHQYAPFFAEFQDKLKNGGSLLYSWNVGMGVNFAALYAYYLASPLNWLLLLCPSGLVIEFMTYSIVLKIGLSGLSMAYYLRRRMGTQDFGVAFFGIFYALSGYMAAYSWNIMWLDCILLFPLVVLGLEKLVHEGKGMLYCLTLGLSIFSNYYISIMTCIFMVLYFIALLILEQEMSWEKWISRTFQFAVYSLLAGGLAAVVLLPEVFALQATASGDISFPKTFSQYFSIIDMFARHIGNVETEIGLEHWPNIYCGVAVLMLLILYFIQKEIRGREKAVYGVLLLFFFASFSINVLNFIWHGFHYPNSLPCRQSYIYIFLVLFMSCQAYLHLKETSWNHILWAFWGAVGFVLLAQKLVTQEHFHFIVYYVAILFLGLYLGGIWLYRKGPGQLYAALLYTLVIVSVEAAANTAVTSVTTTSRTAYTQDNRAVETLVRSVEPGDTFYRMEKVTRKTKNDGAWMHFPSVSLFSSTASADLSDLFKKLGCESSTNAYSITGSTPLIDMLFAVRYGIYSEAPEGTGLRAFVAQEEDTLLYENTYTLPLGFWVPSDFESNWALDAGKPADVQNSLAAAVGAGPVLETVLDVSAEGKSLRFYPEVSGEYYAYVTNKKIEKVTTKTWKESKTYHNVDRGYFLELGYCLAGEEVVLEVDEEQNGLWADIYCFSETELASVYNGLSQIPWNLTSWTDAGLAGTIACQDSGMMLTTIPYDTGWIIEVDGVRQPAVKMLGAFVGVRLTPGSHTIQMEYEPQGLKKGAWITALSVLALLLIAAGGRIYRRRMEADIEADMEADMEPDAESGMEPDMESGMEPDIESGRKPDAESGMESGRKPDAESGMEPDMESGRKPDMESGRKTIQEYEENEA